MPSCFPPCHTLGLGCGFRLGLGGNFRGSFGCTLGLGDGLGGVRRLRLGFRLVLGLGLWLGLGRRLLSLTGRHKCVRSVELIFASYRVHISLDKCFIVFVLIH